MSLTNKEKYRELCVLEPTIPIFSQAWWLDVVCCYGEWDVVLIEQGGEIIAAMPYYISRKYGFKRITNPKLVPYLGVWLKYPAKLKYTRRVGYENEVFEKIINELPEYDSFSLGFNYSFQNWLSFYWSGFYQTTHYSYVIEDLSNLELVWDNMRENIRWEIRKAEKKRDLVVVDNLGIDIFLDVNALTFSRQNKKPNYKREFIELLDKVCEKKDCRKIFFALDKNNNVHAAIYIIWDQNSAYYLMGGGDPKLRNSGATSLLMWEAIKFAATKTKSFDFEGSMIKPIEKFFRGFGGKQKTYFFITKVNSKLLKLYTFLKNF